MKTNFSPSESMNYSWAAVAVGAVSITAGLVSKGKAKKEAKKLANSRPDRESSPLIQDNLDLGESELASGGLSARAERAYNNLNDKQFSSSLDAILKGGGSVNNIADVFGENEEGKQRLALLNDNLRLKQIDNLVRERSMAIEEVDKNMLFNEYAPWADAAQANAEARKSADDRIWSGVDTFAGGASSYLGQLSDKKQYDDYMHPELDKSSLKQTYGKDWRTVYRRNKGQGRKDNYNDWLNSQQPGD